MKISPGKFWNYTLGVDGGYRQADVTAFANVLTGWSIGTDQGRFKAGTPGAFVFHENAHEPGSRPNPIEIGEQSLGANFSEHTRMAIMRAESVVQGTTLLLASPDFQRR